MTDMDEKLSAYLDGMLDESESSGVAALIADNPAVAERLEALALATSDFVQSASVIDAAPMSPALAAQLARLHVEVARPGRAGNVTQLPQRKQFVSFLETHRAVAAAAAIATGLIAVQISMPPPKRATGLPADGLILADSGLERLLNEAASGSMTAVGKALDAEVRFSFESVGGAPCRLADLSSEGGTSRIVACRETTGWRVMVASFSAPPSLGNDSQYQTAGATSSEAIEIYLDSAMAGPAMTALEEAKRISEKWPASQ